MATAGRGMRAAVILLALALGGCALGTPSGGPSGFVSAPPGSTTPDGLARPAAQFPGGCDQLLPASDLNAAVGFPMTLATAPMISPVALALIEQSGQLSCEWTGGSNGARNHLVLTARRHVDLRSKSQPPFGGITGTLGTEDSWVACTADGASGYACQFEAVVNDYWLTGYLDGVTPGATVESAQALVATLSTPAVTLLIASSDLDTWSPPAGSWPTTYDCAALASSVDVAAVLKSVPLTVADETALSDDGSIDRDVAALGGGTSCVWRIPDSATPTTATSVFVLLGAGTGWSFNALLPSTGFAVETVDVPGADAAAVLCVATSCSFTARLGVNGLTVSGYADYEYTPLTRDQVLAVGTAVVAALAK